VEIASYEKFANAETRVCLEYSVRGKQVYVIVDVMSKSSEASLNDRYMQAKLLVQTAKNHGAESVSIILPAYPYARQDKPVHA
jgi:ribose-phosphate pyrophosphokinase